MTQFFFGFLNVFSGQNLFEPWMYAMFNVIFTMAPIMYYAIFDYQFLQNYLINNPQEYSIGPQNKSFNRKTFWLQVFEGIFQGLFLVFLTSYSFEEQSINEDGKTSSFWVTGCIVYFGVVLICNVRLIFAQHSHSLLSGIIQLLSISSFIIVHLIENQIDQVPELDGTFRYLWLNTQTYFLINLECFSILFIQIIYKQTLYVYSVFKIKRIKKYIAPLDEKNQTVKLKIIGGVSDTSNEINLHQHHGFAFSQEPGHIPQIMNRLDNALYRFNSINQDIINSQDYSDEQLTIKIFDNKSELINPKQSKKLRNIKLDQEQQSDKFQMVFYQDNYLSQSISDNKMGIIMSEERKSYLDVNELD